ncbi:MAG: thioredoxin family protein [Candidatus Woesearchaeota archaeon]
MAILDNETREQVKRMLNRMTDSVQVLFFDSNTEYGPYLRELLEELQELNQKIVLKVYDKTSKEAQDFGIDKFPAVVLIGKNKGKIRFFGIPAGYEFSTFIEDLIMVSNGNVELSKKIIDSVSELDKSLHIMVFVTPTCPYCPSAVKLAHQFAMLNENIIADMIEASEFEDLSRQYKVFSVPHTIINSGKAEFVGMSSAEKAWNIIENALKS